MRPLDNAKDAGNAAAFAFPIASTILSSASVYQGVRASQVNGPECVWDTLMIVFLIPNFCLASSPTRVETNDRKSHVTKARLLSPDSITSTVAYSGSCVPVAGSLRSE